MGNKLNSLLTAAIFTGVLAGQAVLAEDHAVEEKSPEGTGQEAKPKMKRKKVAPMKCGAHKNGKKGTCSGNHEEHHGDDSTTQTPAETH